MCQPAPPPEADQLDQNQGWEPASARPTDHAGEAPSSYLPLKRKGIQTETPMKRIKTEADADEWGKSERKYQQNLLEQPGTSSSTASSSSCVRVTDSFSTSDVLKNVYEPCEPDDSTGWDSSETDESEEASADCSLPEDLNSIIFENSRRDLVPFSASSLRVLNSRDRSLLFFDVRISTSKILQLAVVDGEETFRLLIQPLKCLPGLISKGAICEIGVKNLLHNLSSVHNPILAGYDLWSLALPVLFQSLALIDKKEEFCAAIFGFLDILPLVKEKIPSAPTYKLKNLASTYICQQINDSKPQENAKALRDLCTVLEVDPVQDETHVVTCSTLECYASLQPLLNEKLLTKPSVQTLSMHNVSLCTLHTVYLRDPEKGLRTFCRFLNSRLRGSEKKIQKLSKIKAHFQSLQPEAGSPAVAADELPRALKNKTGN